MALRSLWRALPSRRSMACSSASCRRACLSATSGAARSSAQIFEDHLDSVAPRSSRATATTSPASRTSFGPRLRCRSCRSQHPEALRAIGELLPPGARSSSRARSAESRTPSYRSRATPRLQQPDGVRRQGGQLTASTTRSISFRSASTCPCSRFSKRSGCEQLTRMARWIRSRARRRGRCLMRPGPAAGAAASSATRRFSRRGRCRVETGPGSSAQHHE